MAKRGTFGGSRFGYTGFGRSGFKKGFGRASFGTAQGVAQEMMRMFKEMHTPGFDKKFGQTGPVQIPRERPFRPVPDPGAGTYVRPLEPTNPFYDNPETPMPGPKMGPPKAQAKQKPVKFRPKLTRGAR